MPTPIIWLAATQTNTGTAANESHSDAQIIGLSNGNYLVAWVETGTTGVGTTDGNDIIGKIFNAEGTLIRDSFRINTNLNADDEDDFSIAATNDGGFVITYVDDDLTSTNRTSIIWERHNAAGDMTITRTLADENIAADYLANPQVAFDLVSGNSYVTFQDDVGTDANISAFTISSTGVVGTEYLMSSSSAVEYLSNNDVAVLTNGNVVNVSQSADGDISVYIRSSTGTFLINGLVNNSASSGIGSDPQVAALSDGNFVVTWTEGSDIKYRVYPSSGSAVGATAEAAAASGAANQNESTVIGLPQGGFVIAWDNDTDGNLQAQLFTNAGVADGAVFVASAVGTTTPTINVTADGRILFTWIDQGTNDVFTTIWDPRGATINGGDFDNANRSFVDNTGPITGNSLSNTITDSPDADGTIIGGSGNDVFIGVEGVTGDTFNGGAGNDTLDNSGVGFVSTVNVNLGAGTIDVNGGGNIETLISIENYLGGGAESITGSSANNLLEGGSGDNTINGEAGDDTIRGLGGNDVINGGSGVDVLEGGDGDDIFIDGDAINTGEVFNGGVGNDTLDASSTPILTDSVTVNLGAGTRVVLAGNTETLISIENYIGSASGSETIIGSSGINILTGGSGDNIINGEGGSDTINGGGGNDTITGGSGVDTIDGGSGDDTIIFSTGSFNDNINGGTGVDTLDATNGFQAINLNLLTETYIGYGGTFSITGVETIIGTTMDDVLINNNNSGNTLQGGDGNDTIHSGLNANETLDGGLGIDTLNTSSYNGTYTIDLTAGTTNFGEIFTNFENLISGDGADTVTGTSAANNIQTNGGNDVIDSGGGNDTVYGGAGNDTITSLSGNNVLSGGAGNDIINTGSGVDQVFGGDGDDVFVDVGSGGDTFDGGAGRDRVDYSALIGGTGVDYYWSIGSGFRGFSTFSSPVQITFIDIEDFAGFDGNDQVQGTGANNQIDGNAGNDWLRGFAGTDTLNGGDGDDLLDGGTGNDAMNGGAGNDIYYVDAAGDSVIEGAAGGIDEIRTTVNNFTLGANVENLRLQGGAVVGTGNALDNTINAGAGPATLNGLGGNDVLNGSGNSDTLNGGSGDDFIYGRNGNDNAFGGTGNDTIRGQTGSDILRGEDGNDLIFGDEGQDTLYGGLGNDDLRGGIQNDTLYGEGGDDLLRGEDGNDNLYGGAGRDFFTGGAGNDNFYFEDGDFSGLTLATADRIVDFQDGFDRIRLTPVDANTLVAGNQNFTFIGTGAFTNVAGQLRYQISGANTLVFGDTNGDGVADFAIALTGAYALDITDFGL